MQTTVDEIAPDIFRLSTFVPEVGPTGFTFNQFLVRDDEPFLFHTGMRELFPFVSEAIGRVVPVESLRWISFGHVEADECGAMNELFAAAPHAQVVHGELACMVSLNDLADRPPRPMADGEVLGTGHHRLRFLATPHVPHNWESGLWFDEPTSTLFAGDLFTALGNGPALVTDSIVQRRSRARRCSTRRRSARPPCRRCGGSPTSARRRWRPCTARRTRATAPASSSSSPTPTPRWWPRACDRGGGGGAGRVSRG